MAQEFYTAYQKMQRIAENTATRHDVASSTLGKTGIPTQLNDVRAGGLDDRSLVASKIVVGTLTYDEYGTAQMGGDKIFTNGIDRSSHLSTGVVTNTKIDTDAITSPKILAGAVVNSKIDTGAVTSTKIGSSAVGNSELAANAVTSGKINSGAVDSGALGNSSVLEAKINDGAVTAAKVDSAYKNGSETTFSLRTLSGSGSALSAAHGNHTHASVNFKHDYTQEERERSVGLRAAVRDIEVGDVTWPKFDALRQLVLDLAHQLMDEPHESADSWVPRVRNDPEFRHGFLMDNDPRYYAAYMREFDPVYKHFTNHDEKVIEMARQGRERHGPMTVRHG